jgi:hypothetical protein
MSLIKKVDVPAYFAARRAMRLGGILPARQAKSIANAAKFKKDFSDEHSSSSAPLPSKE